MKYGWRTLGHFGRFDPLRGLEKWYADRARSLLDWSAIKGDLDPDFAQEGRGATDAVGERVGAVWPVPRPRHAFVGEHAQPVQKLRSGASPWGFLLCEQTQRRAHQIGLKDGVDHFEQVIIVGGHEGP